MLNWPEGSSGAIRFDRMNMSNGRVAQGRVLRKGNDFRGNNLDFTVVNGEAWVVFHDGEVQAFDTRSWFKTAELTVPNQPTGTAIETLGDRVAIGGFDKPYATGAGRVTIYDALAKTVIAQHAVPQRIVAMATAPSVFIAVGALGDVYVFNARDGAWVTHVQLTEPLSEPHGVYVLGRDLFMTVYPSGGGSGSTGQVARVSWEDGD